MPDAPRVIASWEALETEVQDELARAQRSHRAAWHRFYDTRATQGGFLPPQPSDFMVGWGGQLTFVEAKFTSVHSTLKSCFANVRDTQIASHRIWARAGFHNYLVLVYCLPVRVVEVWDGSYLTERRLSSARLQLTMRRTYATVSEALRQEIGYA